MPTEAVTTTKTVNTAGRQADPQQSDPQQGAFPRRSRTVDGKVIAEELRPGSKAWQEVP